MAIVFLAGLGAACGAVLGPGMLNMSVVKTSLQHGRKPALLFAGGIVSIFFTQASVGVIGANYLGIDQEMIAQFKIWAIPVFFSLAIFFIYRGFQKLKEEGNMEEEDELDERDAGKHYLAGLSLAMMNLLGIPYFYALSTWLFGNEKLPSTTLAAKAIFVFAAAVGAFSIFTAYTFAAPWFRRNARTLTRNINFVVGLLLIIATIGHSYQMFFAG